MNLGVIVVLCAGAGLLSGQAKSANEPAPDTLITLQRGACEQRCAVYRLVIFADGSVLYDGRSFVRRTGLIKSGVQPEVLSKLIKDLETGGFFDLEADYGYGDTKRCETVDSDGPTAILSVSSRGRSKTVLHNHRCVGQVSKKLTELEDKVDRAVGTAKWIK